MAAQSRRIASIAS